MYTETAAIIKAIVGNEYLYFDTPVNYMKPEIQAIYSIWGVCVSPDNIIYAMGGDEEWYEVDAEQDKVIIDFLYPVMLKMQARHTQPAERKRSFGSVLSEIFS